MPIRSLRSLIGPPVCSGRAAGRTSTPAAPHAHRRAALAAHGGRRARPAPPRHRRRADRRRDHVRAGPRPVQRVRPDGATGAGRPRAGGDHPVRLRDPVVRVAVRTAAALDAAPVAPTTPSPAGPAPRRGGHRPTCSRRATCSCSACSPPPRCRRRSSTPCSRRRCRSPPTTSASATAPSASPARWCAPASCWCCPAAALADRRGRRTIVVAVAVAAPLVTAAGALAPTFPFLVATQALGRPLGLVLDFMVAVVAAEEMPRNSRAYAVSVLALASGLGAGVAILALPLADLSPGAWRYVYLVVADLAGRRRRPRPPAPRERAVRTPARDGAAARPAPVRRARRRSPCCRTSSSPRRACSRTATSRTSAASTPRRSPCSRWSPPRRPGSA